MRLQPPCLCKRINIKYFLCIQTQRINISCYTRKRMNISCLCKHIQIQLYMKKGTAMPVQNVNRKCGTGNVQKQAFQMSCINAGNCLSKTRQMICIHFNVRKQIFPTKYNICFCDNEYIHLPL